MLPACVRHGQVELAVAVEVAHRHANGSVPPKLYRRRRSQQAGVAADHDEIGDPIAAGGRAVAVSSTPPVSVIVSLTVKR